MQTSTTEGRSQRVVIPPRSTRFNVVCAQCQASQPESRGYIGAIVTGELSLDDDQGAVTCRRGHVIELIRESAASLRY
jgi:hypothetical protein